MANRLEQVPLSYWCADKSTQVQFEPTSALPPQEFITACFVYAKYQNQIVICKGPRGWGLPGGHREAKESPEDCIRREALEEAAIELGDVMLVGQWVATKLIDSPHNKNYPKIGYQLLYLAQVTNLLVFEPKHETSERMLVTPDDLGRFHHNYGAVENILLYIHQNY